MSSFSFNSVSVPVLGPVSWVSAPAPDRYLAVSLGVPSSFSFGGVSCPAARFRSLGRFVLVRASWSGPRDASGSLVVFSECGARFECRFAGLPAEYRSGVASAVRAAVADGEVVELLGAPGRRGVCPGFFCGLRSV